MCSYTISVAHTFRNTLATFNFIIVGYNTRIPTLIVKFWITKQFDKSGFNKIIEFGKLTGSEINYPPNSSKLRSDAFLRRYWRKIKCHPFKLIHLNAFER